MDNKQTFCSNGKLLLTGEYFVLEGAKALALPTQLGQTLVVESLSTPNPLLSWKSFNEKNKAWLQVSFDTREFYILHEWGNGAKRLQQILRAARMINPSFLTKEIQWKVHTQLGFPRDWGLGSSSTLINNIALWAEIDPFPLQFEIFGGSGYDVACARHDTPIFYQKINQQAIIKEIVFSPPFQENLFFIHLNKKQNSRQGIQHFYAHVKTDKTLQNTISEISEAMVNCTSLADFNGLMEQHENIVAENLGLKKVKELYFSDFWGSIKSLGAWGGDFVLATSEESFITTQKYFAEKGFMTCLAYKEMIKQ